MHSVRIASISIAFGLLITSTDAAEHEEQQPAEISVPVSGTSDFKVTLLGTGTHGPRPDRFGPSTLVEAGAEKLVFDCGRSCTTRLWQLKVPLGTVKLFVTHLHADHTVGIPDLWLTGWLPMPYGGRREPFKVWGPKGTKDMMSALQKAYAANIQAPRSFTLSQEQVGIDARDFAEGIVYGENGVRVTAFKVTHGAIDAFGFRVDYRGRSVVISGDMSPNENLIKYGSGADVVIHEVAAANPELLQKSDVVRRIVANHCTPEEAGKNFARIKPKLAVYTHFALFSGEGVAEVTIPDIIARTRSTYSGPLAAGEDLMQISIGNTVSVEHNDRAAAKPCP
jgi:ribonuclease Z